MLAPLGHRPLTTEGRSLVGLACLPCRYVVAGAESYDDKMLTSFHTWSKAGISQGESCQASHYRGVSAVGNWGGWWLLLYGNEAQGWWKFCRRVYPGERLGNVPNRIISPLLYK